MLEKNLINLSYTSQEIEAKTQKIMEQLLVTSDTLDDANFTAISNRDLKTLFELYDQFFFDNFFSEQYNDKIFFRLSTRMTKAGGKTRRVTKDGTFIISLSTTLIFQTFQDITREIIVNGVVCHNRLEAAMRVFEHEIIHVLEYILFDDSSCSKPSFRRLCNNIFGHTDVTHQLVTKEEIAHEQYDLHVGDNVSFEFEGRVYHGIIGRITKRATVFVRDPNGQFTDPEGNRYVKFYIPLQFLTRE